MARNARSVRRLKADDNNNTKRTQVGGKGVTSGSTMTNTSNLRRSTRDTSSKKQRTSSPLSARKSERIEKHMPETSPTLRKSKRVENQKMPSTLRRSERGVKIHSSSLSGLKMSEKSSSSLETENKELKIEKSEKQLKLNSEDRKRNTKKGRKSVRPTSRRYRVLFNPLTEKVKEPGIGEKLEVHIGLSQWNGDNAGASGSFEVELGGHCSESKVEEVRGVDISEGCERDLEGSSSPLREPTDCILRHQREIERPDFRGKRKHCLLEAGKTKNRDNSPVREDWKDVVIAKKAIGDAEKMQIDCSVREDLQEPVLMESPSEGRSLPGGCELESNGKVGAKRKRLDMGSNVANPKDGEEIFASAAGSSDTPAGYGSQLLPSSTIQMDGVRYQNVNDISDVPGAQLVDLDERRKLRESQKNLHILLKPEMSKLCGILQLPEDVKEEIGKVLEYIMNNHHVNKDPETILQAFQISLCWAVASLLKHKVCHKEALALAKQHLNFECKEEEAEYVYDALRKMLKKVFFSRAKNVAKSSNGKNSARTTDDAKHHLHTRDQSMVSDQQELAEGEIRESPQSLHCFDQHISAKQKTTDFEKANGSPSNEISKSIKLVGKIHNRRMRMLSTKLMEEHEEFLKKSEELVKKSKEKLEGKHKFESAIARSIHSKIPVIVEKLKLIEKDFQTKLNELNYRMEVEKKKLESMQQAAMNEEKRLKSHWLQEAKSGRPVDSFSKLPLTYSGFRLEDMDYSEQDGVSDGPEKATSISGRSSEEQITDRTGLLRPGELRVVEAPITFRHESVEGAIPTEPPNFVARSAYRCTEHEFNHESLVILPSVELQLPPCTDPPSNPLPSNQFTNHEVSVLPPAVQLQLSSEPLLSKQLSNHDVSDLPPAVRLKLPAPTDPPSDPLLSNQLSNHDLSVLSPAVQLQLPPPTDPPSEALLSNQSSNHDVSVVSHAVQLQLPPLTDPGASVLTSDVQLQLPASTDPPSEPLPSNQSSNHDVSVVSPAVQLQLPPLTNTGASLLTSAFQLQLPASTDIPFEPLPYNQSNHFNHDISVPPPVLQLLLPPTADPRSKHNQPDAPACIEIEHGTGNDEGRNSSDQSRVPTQSRVEDQVEFVNNSASQLDIQLEDDNQFRHTTSQQAEIPTQTPPAEDHAELLSHNANSQPDTMYQLPVCMDGSLGGIRNRLSDARSAGVVPESSNNPVQNAPLTLMSQPLPHHDPLSNELARIRKDEDYIKKLNEDVIMRINSDFEKEIAEIHQKYKKLRQDADTALARKAKALEANFNTVFMSKMLAEVFRFKCSDTKLAGPPDIQQGARPGIPREQLFQPSTEQSVHRPPLVPAADASTAPPATAQPLIEQVHLSSALFSSNNTVVRPHCPSNANYQVGGGELRAPAPHLQPFRPSTSISAAPVYQPLRIGLPISSQQSLSNPAAASFMGPQPAGSPNQTHQSESAGRPRNSSQIFDMMMRDFDNGFGGANSPNLLSPLPSFDPPDLLVPRMQVPSSLSADVVCLSDDD